MISPTRTGLITSSCPNRCNALSYAASLGSVSVRSIALEKRSLSARPSLARMGKMGLMIEVGVVPHVG